MSLNASSRPSVSQSCSSRMPGVSMMTPPAARMTSCRCTLVCRPRESHGRTSPVGNRSSPTSRLTMDDFPTPDGPSSATVWPSPRYALHLIHAEPGLRTEGHDRHVAGDVFRFLDTRVHVVCQVGLVQDDHRSCAAAPGRSEIALNPSRLELRGDREHHKHGVDVRSQNLFDSETAGDLARETGPAGQDFADLRPIARRVEPQTHPVADDGQLVAPGGDVFQTSGGFCEALTVPGEHPIDVIVFERDPPGREASGGERREFLTPRLVPPK